MDLMIGGLAGVGATLFVNPLDVVKTRMQLQGELKSHTDTQTKYRNSFHALYLIAKSEGFLALQKGLIPAIAQSFIITAVRLDIYHNAAVRGWIKKANGEICIYKTIFWAGFGGFCGGSICNPLLIMRTRLQTGSHPSIAVGKQYNYKGTIDGLVKMYKTGGIKSYYTGVLGSGSRLAVGSATQLTTFSKAKEILLAHGIGQTSPFRLALAASALSGMMIVLVVCPIDTATVRLYNQCMHKKGEILYTGLVDCLAKMYKTEGLYGWYKGMGPLYLKLAPQTTICLVIWDVLNHLLKRNKDR